MTHPTAISLFTGCGGMDLAFERAGFETQLQAEIEPACQAVLEKHWPEIERVNDVRNVVDRGLSGQTVRRRRSGTRGKTRHDVHVTGEPRARRISVINFGSPCQDLSVAGRRAGFAGERSGLYAEAIRVVREFRPTFALWENVPGALSSNNGRDFGTAIDLMADAGALDIAWRVLDAQWFGVPQRRRRIFVVADFAGHRAGEILFESQSLSGDCEAGAEAGQSIAATVGGGASGAGRTSDVIGEQVIAFMGGQGSGSRSLESRRSFTDRQAARSGSNQTPNKARTVRASGNGHRNDGDRDNYVVSKPLGAHHGRHDLDNETYVPEMVGQAITASYRKGAGHNGQDVNLVAPAARVRRLTPLECERLQGLPDDWTRYRPDGSELSDSARYKMIGNSVAVPVVEWIARRMRAALEQS